VGARGLSIRFGDVSRVKRSPRKATPDEVREYKSAQKLHNLSQRFVQTPACLRRALDAAGGRAKISVAAADGSFCNRTCMRAQRERTELIVRARKDAVLRFGASSDFRHFHDTARLTLEQIRQDGSRPWPETKIFYGGKRRKVRYKEIKDVYWRTGAAKTPLRLIVVAPTPFRKRNSGRLYYRQPADLPSTDLRSSVKQLLQFYFDRRQIEVNHREEKDTLGVGHAQLWNLAPVPKQPVLSVAAHGVLLLASLQVFETDSGAAYSPLPKWRKKAHRPSCLDLIALLRKEMVQSPHLIEQFSAKETGSRLHGAPAA
jgi:hypothetical protein